MKVLELFCGSKSVGKVCDEKGYDVTSIDLLKKFNADITTDILKWDYKKDYKPNEFDIIWASPPCTEYSIAKSTGVRDLKKADKIVKKTIEIIKYFNPIYWFIENPQTGYLKSRDFMQNIPYYDCDYCRYSDWGVRKRTRIWTNKGGLKLKLCEKKCNNMTEDKKKHKLCLCLNLGKNQRIRIPPKLIHSILS